MAPSFLRKLVSRTKAKRSKVFDLRTIWIRPSLEALDERILPSVTASLNNGILSILADNTGGTTQVEIIHNQDQVAVEDTQQLVNNFGIDQIQQIQFQYTTQAQQQYNLNLPVGQNEISLTGLPVGEADLNLGDSSLTASINAKLPDGTDISLAGMVDSQGNYDVSGHADVTVAGFALQNAGFEVTNTSVAVAAAVAIGQDSVSLSGTLDNQGNYDLTGNADVTVDGFALPATSFELTNTSLAAAATLAIGGDNANLSGTVDSSGNYDLTATLDSMTIGGFTLTNASVELTNTSLVAGATVTLGSDSVTLNGTMDSSGNYDLTGTADITIAGFALPSTGFELTNAPANGIKVATTLPLGDDTVNLSGTVDSDANYDLTATSDSITISGFTLTNASVELTNTSLTVGATLTLGSDSVTLNGTMDSSGNYDLTGTADITIAGFALPSTSFELTNAPANGIKVSATLPLGSDTVSLSGTVDSDGNYDLMGTTDITVGGFALSGASFELTNTSLTVSATLTLGNDSISLSGTVDNQGNYDLTGTADITVGSFALPGASFELTNTSLTVSATLTFGSDSISLSGTVDSDGNYDLTGTADITVGGFALPGASFELTNTSFTVSATLTVGDNSVSLSGTVDDQGNYDLTGTADITVGGFALPGASFELTNTSLTVSATLTFGSDSISLSGTVDSDGNYDLTGTADITVGGFALPSASFELTNTSLTVSATLTVGDNSVSLSGTVDDQGNYDLTGTADITVGGFALPGASFELTNTSLTVSATLTLGSDSIDLSGTVDSDGNYDLTGTANITVATIPLTANFELTNTSLTVSSSVTILGSTVNLSGTVDSDGNYDLTGTSTITVAGFSLNASFELTNTSLTVSSTLDLGPIGSVNLSGTYANGQLGNLTGTATITVDGFNLNANFTLSNTSLTVATTLALGSVATVNLTGTVLNNQGHYSLSNLTGTATITVDGFNLNANFTLTNTSITVATTLALGSVATVNLTGTVNKNGSNYSLSDLTGTAAITVDGFNLNANFTLTSTSITVGATLALGSVATVSLTGTVNKNGSNYSLSNLTGTAAITVDGFNLNANFTLTNTSITVATTLALGSVATVNLAGTVNKNGSNYSLSDLTGTAAITVDGFNLNGSFTLTSTSITVTATLALGSVATVSLTGTVNKNGSNYSLSTLTGTAAITVDGFNLTGNFTLTSTNITVGATLALGSVATVSLTGTVNKNGSNYSLSNLTGTAAITVDGFNLNANFTLTSTSITVGTTLALGSVATVNLTGTVNKNGSSYSLSDLAGTAAVTVDGFNLTGNFTLTSSSITVGATLALGSVATVNLTGTVNKNGSSYSLSDLTGTAAITVDGFNLNGSFKLTSTSITVTATLALGSVATVSLTGTVNKNGSNYSLGDLTGTAAITVGSFSLTGNFKLTPTQITVSTHLDLGSVAKVDLTGTVNKNGSNYSLGDLTGTATITVASFTLSGNFKLTPTQITVGTTVSLGGNLTVNLTGTVNKNGSNYSLGDLTGTAHIVIAGFALDAGFKLTSTSLTVSATVNLPIVGNVNLSGTVDKNGNYSLTAGVSEIHILFVTLTSASVTLTNTSLIVEAHASNLPLIGNVDFKGTITGSSYTFTATIPSVSLLGFTLKNISATLTNSSLSVGTHVDSVPLVGSVDFTGTISSSSFSLAATAHNVTLLGFIHFNSIALTLDSHSLSMSATVSLPIVNTVTFTGAINFNGSFTISATAPHFTVLGFIGIDNAQVSISFPNPKLTVSAHISLLNIGMVDFTGSIGAGGTFSFDGSASLTVAGFTLGTAKMHMGNMPGDPSDGIHIGPFTTPALPLVGPVTIEGSYAAGGRFSFRTTIHPNPPIFIGPIPVDAITFGLSNDSLTLGIGVGYNLAGILNLTGYGEVTVFAASSQHNWGDFDLLATVDVSIVGFSAANGRMELKNTKGQFSFTVDMNLNLLIAHANMHGEIDFNKGLVGFTGRATIGVAGFTLSNSTFLITNAQVQGDDVNGWTFKHDAQGHLISGGGIHIEVHSHTNLNLQPVISANVDFDGTFAKNGSGYKIDVKGKANLTIAGFNLASATLEIDNTHMAVTVHYAYPGIFSADFAGTVTFNGNFDMSATATIGLAGFGATGHLHLYKIGSNAGLDISAHINVIVAQVDFSGYLHSNGQFQLTGTATAGFAGFGATASFTLNNGGVSVSARIGVYVATVSFTGYVRSNGQFQLTGTATAGFAGFGATASFTLNNGGVSVSAHINVFVAQVDFTGYVRSNGQFSLTGSANVGLAGFSVARASFTLNNGGVSFAATINVRVATVSFSGYVHSNGQWQLTGSASVGFAGFGGHGSFTLNNSGLTFSGSVNVIVANINVSGYVYSNGTFRFDVNTRLGFAGFGANGHVTLSNSGVSVSATLDLSVLGIRMNASGTVNSNGTFRFTFHTGLNWGVISASADFTLANTGFSVQLHAGFDLSAGIGTGFWSLRVGFRGSVNVGFGVNTNGTFNASGNVQACAYVGIGLCVGIGFHVNNHQFCFNTHDIGFSIWGVGFHPFGDLCIGY